LAKRSDTLESSLLAIELLRRIPRGRRVTASELHRQLKDAGFDRDLRTIQRQLEVLSEHFDIERDDRCKPYGYRWLDQAQGLAMPNLTAQESLLLGLAEEHLKHLLPANLMQAMDGFFSQARRNLAPEGNAKLERQWRSKVRVVPTSQPRLSAPILAGVFEAASDALYANRWLKLSYRNAGGKLADVMVMPLGLAQQGASLYLICRYEGYSNERSLAMHRIRTAEVSTRSFERPADFDLKKYDDDGRFGLGSGRRIRLSFEVTPDEGLPLIESPLSKDQQVTELAKGGFRITATVVETLVLERWLRGYGKAISNIRRVAVGAKNS